MVKPKPEYLRAFRAFRALGVPHRTVAPVLKDLLQLFNYNWAFIEADQYQVLADAIFDCPKSKDIEVGGVSLLGCEMDEQPPAKRLHADPGEAEALRMTSDATLDATEARASSISCLNQGRAESDGRLNEVPFADDRKVKNRSMSATLAGHPSSLEGASTRSGVSDLTRNHFDNSSSKVSSHSSVLGLVEIPLKYKSSLESVDNSNCYIATEPSTEVATQNGVGFCQGSSEVHLWPQNANGVLHERESRSHSKLGSKGGGKEDNFPDKRKVPLFAGDKYEVKVKQLSLQEHDFAEDDDIWDLSLQEYRNQGIISNKKKLTYAMDMDISRGKEKVKIPVADHNDNVDHLNFCYIATNLIFQDAFMSISIARISDEDCCKDCLGDCLSSPVPCACARETGGEFAYNSQGLLKEEFLEACILMNQEPEDHHFVYCKSCPKQSYGKKKVRRRCKGHLVKKFIKECWSKCGCSLQCGNRVVQRGITRDLQVFWTPEGKGWGLRVAEDLPKGAFVCEYVGEILTNTELHERNKQRSADERHVYPVLLDADWASESILKDEEALCLDATFYGNVARFINHRCEDANLLEIPVEVETPDHHYYHVAFFSNREVKAFEELTWDYGINFDDRNHPVKAFECSCGSALCRDKKRRVVSANPRKVIKAAEIVHISSSDEEAEKVDKEGGGEEAEEVSGSVEVDETKKLATKKRESSR
ncbi:hypothetical protein Dimus_007265 [Dionaea muscipula]